MGDRDVERLDLALHGNAYGQVSLVDQVRAHAAAFAAEQQGDLAAQLGVLEGDLGMRRRRHDGEPFGAQEVDLHGQVFTRFQRHAQQRGGGSAHHLGIVRIARALAEHDGLDPQGRGRAQDRAEIARVLNAVKQRHGIDAGPFGAERAEVGDRHDALRRFRAAQGRQVGLRDHACPHAQLVQTRLQGGILEAVGHQHRVDDFGRMLHHIRDVLDAFDDETRLLLAAFFGQQRQELLDVGRQFGLEGRGGTRGVPAAGITAAAGAGAAAVGAVGFARTVEGGTAVRPFLAFPRRLVPIGPRRTVAAVAPLAIGFAGAVELAEGALGAITAIAPIRAIRLAGAVELAEGAIASPPKSSSERTRRSLAVTRTEIAREFLARFTPGFGRLARGARGLGAGGALLAFEARRQLAGTLGSGCRPGGQAFTVFPRRSRRGCSLVAPGLFAGT